jgi:Leucine-rich repeat (LRR) protein
VVSDSATGLRSLDLSKNYFGELPPALTAATSLSELSLDMNDELEVSPAELKAVLACMPGLEALSLSEHLEPALADICDARGGLKVRWCSRLDDDY